MFYFQTWWVRQCQTEPDRVAAGESYLSKDVIQGSGIEVGWRVVDREAARRELRVRQGQRWSDSGWGAFWGNVTAKGEGQDGGAERRWREKGNSIFSGGILVTIEICWIFRKMLIKYLNYIYSCSNLLNIMILEWQLANLRFWSDKFLNSMF